MIAGGPGRHDTDSDASTECTACEIGMCARAGQVNCASCGAMVDASVSIGGVLPVGLVYGALDDCVNAPEVGVRADGGAVRITTITQTVVRTVTLAGTTVQQFNGSSSAEAVWWRDAFARGVAAAVATAQGAILHLKS